MTPTGRSLELLRELGYVPGIVERRLPRGTVTVDLFGCIDLIAAHPQGGILAIQATTSSNLASRVKKAQAEPRLATWLRAGGRFEAWGWSERGAHGRRKIWGVRRVRAGLDDAGAVRFLELTAHPAIGSPGALPIAEARPGGAAVTPRSTSNQRAAVLVARACRADGSIHTAERSRHPAISRVCRMLGSRSLSALVGRCVASATSRCGRPGLRQSPAGPGPTVFRVHA